MKQGPSWVKKHGVCQRAYECLQDWRARDSAFPPYVAYLGLFVLAAGHHGDFHPISYYPRLRELLSEDPEQTGMYSGFGHMYELWDDLETRVNDNRNEELGRFRAHIQGNKIHIGLPLSQTLFSNQEIGLFPTLFENAQLDPLAPPTDVELISIIRQFGIGRLRPATLRMCGR